MPAINVDTGALTLNRCVFCVTKKCSFLLRYFNSPIKRHSS